MNNSVEIIGLIKKHFNITFDELTYKDGTVWARLVSIQAKEDEGEYETTACANLIDFKDDFEILKKGIENE